MARGKALKVGKKAAPAVRKGFKRVEDKLSPFWAPWDDEHPNPLVGVYLGKRTIPPHGKFPEQDVIDLQTEEGPYTVALKGNLKRLARAAVLGEGQTVQVEWVEKIEPCKELPMGLNIFDLQVQE